MWKAFDNGPRLVPFPRCVPCLVLNINIVSSMKRQEVPGVQVQFLCFRIVSAQEAFLSLGGQITPFFSRSKLSWWGWKVVIDRSTEYNHCRRQVCCRVWCVPVYEECSCEFVGVQITIRFDVVLD